MDSTRGLSRALVAVVVVTATLGLASEVAFYVLHWPATVVTTFSLSYEQNVPTWVSSTLLFACALSLGAIGARAGDRRAARPWRALAGIFGFMSLDESIQIHEHLAYVTTGSGILYFSWVIPASVVVLGVALAFARFLWRLPRSTRTRFVVAGFVYVGGALAMELPLGAWTEAHGDDNLGYALIDFVEESMEIAGASLFLLALERHRRALNDPSSSPATA